MKMYSRFLDTLPGGLLEKDKLRQRYLHKSCSRYQRARAQGEQMRTTHGLRLHQLPPVPPTHRNRHTGQNSHVPVSPTAAPARHPALGCTAGPQQPHGAPQGGIRANTPSPAPSRATFSDQDGGFHPMPTQGSQHLLPSSPHEVSHFNLISQL